ncbi:MAG: hypothetical protein M3463_04690, partial [Verrucomicrobiota bacterium]|nr:hypothetical protein [Verrucomicrobiota bacterium]
MQLPPAFILFLSACALFSGCAGVSPTRIIGNTAGAAGGAIIGHTFGKGDALTTTLGAGGGVLMSEALHAGANSAQQRSYAAGYEKGRSDAAKQQFQALNERQRIAPHADDAAHLRLFEVPLPERRING